VAQALRLLDDGESKKAIARRLGVSRAAIRDWSMQDAAELLRTRELIGAGDTHVRQSCALIALLPKAEYAYLFGQYLGDGCISSVPKGVYRLRIACCDAYPRIMERVESAMGAVMPTNRTGRTRSIGCTEVHADSKHWPCLFPQVGPGRKHTRPIVLADWQLAIVNEHVRPFLAGLFHSDGCRVLNRVSRSRNRKTKTYVYPRYFFSNTSMDILQICGDALDLVDAEWRFNRWNSISVARKASVALLDEFIGPKT
jgi:hypothetical protein